jgi:hypothetical protein
MNSIAVKRLDASIEYIGAIKITSTYRPNDTGSAHQQGLAFDFKPLKRPLWHVYQILRALGWKRIGIDKGQGIIHVDAGDLMPKKFSFPYYFLELAGKDAGPISKQSAATLAAIPGYTRPVTAVAGKPIAVPTGEVKTLTPVAAAGAAGNGKSAIVNAVLLAGAVIPMLLLGAKA